MICAGETERKIFRSGSVSDLGFVTRKYSCNCSSSVYFKRQSIGGFLKRKHYFNSMTYNNNINNNDDDK